VSSLKKPISVLAATFGLVLGLSTVVALPAEAAAKAGASCTKANSRTKIGGDSYICTKNPLVKNAKLTWVWIECINTNKSYFDSAARLTTLKSQVATAQGKINTLKAGLADDETQAKGYDAKAAEAQTKKDAALAKAADQAAKVQQFGATTTAGKAYQKNVDLWNNNAKTYDLAIKNFQRAAKALRDKVNEIADEQKRIDLANQTIAASELQLKATDQSRKQACAPGL
jgi:hypothetical protein